jgi:trigger factor
MSTITIEKTAEDSASKSLRITVPVERVEEAETKALRYYAQRAKLPGFRPGKAPEAVVRKRFGDAIRQAALEELIRESWETAKTTESLQPIADPSIRNLKFEAGNPLEFDLVVEVKPALRLERTGGFKVTRSVAPVTDEQVDDQLRRAQEQKATWMPVEGRKPAPGEMVRVEVTALGDAEHEAAAPQSYDLVLGENQAVPALEETIMTLLPGETAETSITFPDDHPDPARRGQARQVRVSLLEVKQQDLPPLDDAFAREMGDFDTLDALRAAIREDLGREAVRDADAEVRRQLLSQIIESNGVEAPESLVDRFLHAYAHSYEVPHEQHAAFAAQFRPIAETQVKRDMVLDAIVEQQKLAATEEELDGRIAELAERRGVSAGQLYTSLQKANRLQELERSITEEKVFAWLMEQSTVEEAGV